MSDKVATDLKVVHERLDAFVADSPDCEVKVAMATRVVNGANVFEIRITKTGNTKTSAQEWNV